MPVSIYGRLGLHDLRADLGTSEPARGAVAPAWTETPDGEPIVGIEYAVNAEGSEERGAGELPAAIRGSNPRNFAMIPGARTHLAPFSDVNGFVVACRPLTRPWT